MFHLVESCDGTPFWGGHFVNFRFWVGVGFDQKISTASNQLRDLQNASLNTSSSGNQTFIQQGAFQVYVDTSSATNDEEKASIITKRIEETFATLARQLASK